MTTPTPKESGWREEMQNMSFDHECRDVYIRDVLDLGDAIKITEKEIATAIAATEARVVERLADLEADIADKKKELGEIPENTCPDIDKALSEISKLQKDLDYFERNAHRYDSVEDLVKDLPNHGWLDTPDILEKLRADNDQLRNLGREWYTQTKAILEEVRALFSSKTP